MLAARDRGRSIRRLRQLKGLGVCLAIDDFGTGYSSLSYLRRFPIDMVKIDKTFVDGIATGTDERALARAIVRLAHSLKMKTVAEGVELEGQVKRLSRWAATRPRASTSPSRWTLELATAYLLGHTTITLWVGHSGHELEVINVRRRRLRGRSIPGLRVEVIGGRLRGQDRSRARRRHGPQRRSARSSRRTSASMP